jgi:uncharacterized membrane protein (DUF373 family)
MARSLREVFRGQWGDRLYERFENAVMFVLTILLVLMIAFATYHLVLDVYGLLAGGQLDPNDPKIYPDIFSLIFTILIGFEFKHSFLTATATQTSVIRIRSIILIGMLATVRKVIFLDLRQAPFTDTVAVAASILALGIVYWLVRDSESEKKVHAEHRIIPHDT